MSAGTGRSGIAYPHASRSTTPEFGNRVETLRSEVLAHAEREEHEEHPRLEQTVEEEQLRHLAKLFRAAEETAPTRPYPVGRESAPGHLVVGPSAAIVDRARDAIREARETSRR